MQADWMTGVRLPLTTWRHHAGGSHGPGQKKLVLMISYIKRYTTAVCKAYLVSGLAACHKLVSDREG